MWNNILYCEVYLPLHVLDICGFNQSRCLSFRNLFRMWPIHWMATPCYGLKDRPGSRFVKSSSSRTTTAWASRPWSWMHFSNAPLIPGEQMLYVAVNKIRHKTVMSIYSDKLAHVQVVINRPYSVAHWCTSEAMLAHNLVPTIWKPDHSKSWFFCVFQMVSDKMAAICPDFKWFGFRISDPIWNPDHLQPNLFLTTSRLVWISDLFWYSNASTVQFLTQIHGDLSTTNIWVQHFYLFTIRMPGNSYILAISHEPMTSYLPGSKPTELWQLDAGEKISFSKKMCFLLTGSS